MIKYHEAMQKALDALESRCGTNSDERGPDGAITVLRAILDWQKFREGDEVEKISGSAWDGAVCGFYSTSLTPRGYAVESSAHPGSVQIYPASALRLKESAK